MTLPAFWTSSDLRRLCSASQRLRGELWLPITRDFGDLGDQARLARLPHPSIRILKHLLAVIPGQSRIGAGFSASCLDWRGVGKVLGLVWALAKSQILTTKYRPFLHSPPGGKHFVDNKGEIQFDRTVTGRSKPLFRAFQGQIAINLSPVVLSPNGRQGCKHPGLPKVARSKPFSFASDQGVLGVSG
jgi:hypothetical protein